MKFIGLSLFFCFIWSLTVMWLYNNVTPLIVFMANLILALVYLKVSKKTPFYSRKFLFAFPVGAILGLWGSYGSSMDNVVAMVPFIAFIFNAIGLLILILIVAKRAEDKEKYSRRLNSLSIAVQSSMMGGAAMTGIATYQGMCSSFAMPMLNQDVSVRTPEEHIFQSAIHPTTGFPMSNEGFDIAGNPIGMAMHPSAHTIFQPNINPASGMPMMNDSLDIHGSPYGVVGMNDYHSGMSSGYNNDHYAHSSSSIDHYNQH